MMRNVVRKVTMAFLLLLSVPGNFFAAESIVIKGSTTVLPIAQSTLEAFVKKNPDLQISLSGGGSGEGIKAMIDKTTDIATSSRGQHRIYQKTGARRRGTDYYRNCRGSSLGAC